MNFHELNNSNKQQPELETERFPHSGAFIFPVPAGIILCFSGGAGPRCERWIQTLPVSEQMRWRPLPALNAISVLLFVQ